MNKTILYHLLALLLLFGIVSTATAQVTIGAGTKPSVFSVLELSTESTKGGLRLPHLTTQQRIDLGFEVLAAIPTPSLEEQTLLEAAQGLTIFNTTSQCIEYWDTREWISMCVSSASFYLKTPPPVPAAGGSTPLIQPEGGSACSKNPPYSIDIVAGINYVVNPNIVTDASLGQFQVEFHPNPTALPRYVIVRVTDNCTNLYRDLSIQQLANTSLCVDPATVPIINSKAGGAGTNETMCTGADVLLWLTNTNSIYTYIWTHNGLEIPGANGTTYIATKGGDYAVVVGAIGCTNGLSATKKIIEDKNNQAGPAPLITASNGGVMCGGGTVVLRAYDGVTPLLSDWYQNGVLRGNNVATMSISNSTDAGIWTATASTVCGSKQSNAIVVKYDNTTPGGLNPLVLTIDGTNITANPVICKESSIVVEVTNAADYASLNPTYIWFINGVKVLEGSSPKVILTAPDVTNINLEVQLVTPGYCPLSKDYSTSINTTGLVKPRLNDGRTEAFICGTAQAVRLEADVTDGVNYEWIYNGFVKDAGAASSKDYAEAGTYQVRYKKGNCWSPLSNPIELKNQAFLNLNWDNNTPPNDEAVGTVVTLGAYTAPEAVQYTWTSSDPAIIKVTPLASNNRFVTIEYLAAGSATITVRATNQCGYKEISKLVNAGTTSCPIIDNLNFTKNPATGTVGATLTYEVAYTGGSATIADHKFDWVVKNVNNAIVHTSNLSGASGKTFTYTFTPEGMYTVEVTAYDVCQTDPLTHKKVSQKVAINPDITVIPPAPGTYSMTGSMCYDIALSGPNLAGRKSSFLDANGNDKYEFDYKLLGTPMTNISALTVGAGANLLLTEAPIVNTTTATITLKFSKTGVNSVDATGISFTLVALFTNGANSYKIERRITVQDKACCGAATVGGGWLTFMCHNLGADESLDPFTFVSKGALTGYDIKGDLYQWGRQTDGHEKRNSIVSKITGSTVPNRPEFITQTTLPYDWVAGGQNLTRWGDGSQNENMPKANNDPCPSGWKVPSSKQWINISTTTTSPNIWTWTGDGFMVGTALYLPAAGSRSYNYGVISGVGSNGSYWTSTVDNNQEIRYSRYMRAINDLQGTITVGVLPNSSSPRATGMSVRCVPE